MTRKTFIAGQPLTASEVNTYLMTQAVQTYADAAARTTAIPTPTEGQIVYLNDVNQFQASHGGTTWYPIAGQMPLFDATRLSTMNLLTGTETLITFSPATVNRGGFVYNAGLITVPHAGLYDITALIGWSGNSTGYRINRVYVNGSTTVLNDYNSPGMANAFIHGANITGLTLAAGDTIEVRGLQNSGATLTAGTQTRLIVRYVCP